MAEGVKASGTAADDSRMTLLVRALAAALALLLVIVIAEFLAFQVILGRYESNHRDLRDVARQQMLVNRLAAESIELATATDPRIRARASEQLRASASELDRISDAVVERRSELDARANPDAPQLESLVHGPPHFLAQRIEKYTELARTLVENGDRISITTPPLAGEYAWAFSALHEQDDAIINSLDQVHGVLSTKRAEVVEDIREFAKIEFAVMLISIVLLWPLAFRPLVNRLRRDESQTRLVANSLPMPMAYLDPELRIRYANRPLEQWCNRPARKLLGMSVQDALNGSIQQTLQSHLPSFTAQPATLRFEINDIFPHSGSHQFEAYAAPDMDSEAILRGVLLILLDVTERKALEEQLRQSQKMESIGHLTGGIAHDFNNLLGVILGSLDLLKRDAGEDPRFVKRIETAQGAAERGAELASRMLAFARRQELHPVPVDINDVITELAELLPHTLGQDIEVETVLAPSLPLVLLDRSQFEGVLLNLAINSRNAMDDGGTLSIRTGSIELGCQHAAVQDGQLSDGTHVVVTIRDTGHGMTQETLEHAFEPFYSTKPNNQGTGLGLSMVYGFIKQSGGLIEIDSEPDQGTTITIYLPCSDDMDPDGAVDVQFVETESRPRSRGATILVVDDEPDLLEITEAYLRDLGYSVYTAGDDRSAVEILAEHDDIDLLLTDVILPGERNGPGLAQSARELLPAIRVVYTSGYPSAALSEKSERGLDAPLVRKPFDQRALAETIRSTLHGESQ